MVTSIMHTMASDYYVIIHDRLFSSNYTVKESPITQIGDCTDTSNNFMVSS